MSCLDSKRVLQFSRKMVDMKVAIFLIMRESEESEMLILEATSWVSLRLSLNVFSLLMMRPSGFRVVRLASWTAKVVAISLLRVWMTCCDCLRFST